LSDVVQHVDEDDAMVFFLIGGCFIVFFLLLTSQQKTDLLRAKHSYENALNTLAMSPTDPYLRSAALDAGREYANLARFRQGVGIADEVSLGNDISAACAAAAVHQPPAKPAKSETAGKLQTLNELRSAGLVSEEEFTQMRTVILQELAS
jgi:hypothetical protein